MNILIGFQYYNLSMKKISLPSVRCKQGRGSKALFCLRL